MCAARFRRPASGPRPVTDLLRWPERAEVRAARPLKQRDPKAGRHQSCNSYKFLDCRLQHTPPGTQRVVWPFTEAAPVLHCKAAEMGEAPMGGDRRDAFFGLGREERGARARSAPRAGSASARCP
jgi:hypothetical protein